VSDEHNAERSPFLGYIRQRLRKEAAVAFTSAKLQLLFHSTFYSTFHSFGLFTDPFIDLCRQTTAFNHKRYIAKGSKPYRYFHTGDIGKSGGYWETTR
jgi:hypothetical protein